MMNTSVSMRNTLLMRVQQIIVGLAGIFYSLTGIALLFAPTWFFQHIGYFPPYNQHYEGDLGSFLLAPGIGLLVASTNLNRHLWVVRVAATGSLLHVGNHIYDALFLSAPLSQWPGTIVPLVVLAVLLIIISWGGTQNTQDTQDTQDTHDTHDTPSAQV